MTYLREVSALRAKVCHNLRAPWIEACSFSTITIKIKRTLYHFLLLDIDECVIGISKCAVKSVCINTPGWYKCDCIEGYHSRWPDNNYGSLCVGR